LLVSPLISPLEFIVRDFLAVSRRLAASACAGSRVELLWCAPVSNPVVELSPGLVFVAVIWDPARALSRRCAWSSLVGVFRPQ
jgi:hypothetical protein